MSEPPALSDWERRLDSQVRLTGRSHDDLNREAWARHEAAVVEARQISADALRTALQATTVSAIN